MITVNLFLNSSELCSNLISLTKDENLCIPTQPVNTGEEYCGILNPVLINFSSLDICPKFIFRDFGYSRRNLKSTAESFNCMRPSMLTPRMTTGGNC